jgi:hypothetical protein
MNVDTAALSQAGAAILISNHSATIIVLHQSSYGILTAITGIVACEDFTACFHVGALSQASV